MSERSDKELVEEILEAIERIETYMGNVSLNEFKEDGKTVDAVLMNLIVIGESTNRLTEVFKEKYSEMDWFRIRGLRNRVAHDYRATDMELIYQIAKSNLTDLKNYLTKILLSY